MASKTFLVGLDLNKNELQNAVIQNLGTAPSSPIAGQIYFNTNDDTLYFYDGTAWVDFVQQATIAADTIANRPAAGAGNADTLFYAIDTHLLYYSDGSTWSQVSQFGNVSSQTTYGDTSANGTSNSYARADHTHGTPSLSTNTPQNLTIGGTGSAGSGTLPSKDDHVHAMPAFGTVSAQTTFGASSADGTATSVAHSDHTHGTPTHDDSAHSLINISALDVPAADVAWAGYKITGLGNPSADQDAATKYYVDQAVQGLTWKQPANLLSTANVALSGTTGTLNIDTYGALTSADNGYRIVLTNQTTDTEDGIYVYNDLGAGTYTLTRATDANPYTELLGATIYILEGTTKAGTSWSQQNHYLTSFAGQNWVQISGPGFYTAGNGIDISSNIISAVVAAGGGLSLSGSGLAIDTAVVVSKYAASVGDNSSQSITVSHGLNTKDVQVTVYDNSSPYAEVVCDVQHTSTSAITLLFSVAPTTNQYRVVVQG